MRCSCRFRRLVLPSCFFVAFLVALLFCLCLVLFCWLVLFFTSGRVAFDLVLSPLPCLSPAALSSPRCLVFPAIAPKCRVIVTLRAGPIEGPLGSQVSKQCKQLFITFGPKAGTPRPKAKRPLPLALPRGSALPARTRVLLEILPELTLYPF